MLRTDIILDFCEKEKFFTSKPSRTCILNAMKLDSRFGLFIKESMVHSITYESAELFIKAYKQSCSGVGHS